jgi:hypothetical protein
MELLIISPQKLHKIQIYFEKTTNSVPLTTPSKPPQPGTLPLLLEVPFVCESIHGEEATI